MPSYNTKVLSPDNKVPVEQTVKQETNVNIHVNDGSTTTVDDNIVTPPPQYPPPQYPPITPIYADTPIARDVGIDSPDTHKLQSTINFLKQVINLIQSNPLVVSSVVIASPSELGNLIPLLIDNCTDVEIKVDDDSLIQCCQRAQFAKVEHILVTVNGELKNLKYQYPDVYSQFQSYNISLKYVKVD